MFETARKRESNLMREQPQQMNKFMFGPQAVKQTPDKTFNITSLLQSPKLYKGLDNVQQVLSVIETAAPMIQEYGTIVKNLPAMYRIMKTLKNADDLFDDSENSDKMEVGEENDYVTNKVASVEYNTEENLNKKSKRGTSQPKLYI